MFRDNNVVVEENIPFVFENFTVDIYEIFSMIFLICHQNRIKIHLTINLILCIKLILICEKIKEDEDKIHSLLISIFRLFFEEKGKNYYSPYHSIIFKYNTSIYSTALYSYTCFESITNNSPIRFAFSIQTPIRFTFTLFSNSPLPHLPTSHLPTKRRSAP